MQRGRFPEAQVAFELGAAARPRPRPGPRAPRRGGAAHRRGALRALAPEPASPPSPSSSPRDRWSEAPTLLLQGVATDDRGIAKVEFRVGDRLVGDYVPGRLRLRAGAPADLRARAAPRARPERDRGHRHRHRRPLALGAVHGRAAPALPRDAAGSCPSAAAGAVGPDRPRLGRAAPAATPGPAPPLQPLHRGGPRPRRRHVLRAREADRPHAEHAPPQQPDDHRRAADRQDHLPPPPASASWPRTRRASGGSSPSSSTSRASPSSRSSTPSWPRSWTPSTSPPRPGTPLRFEPRPERLRGPGLQPRPPAGDRRAQDPHRPRG